MNWMMMLAVSIVDSMERKNGIFDILFHPKREKKSPNGLSSVIVGL
jgi:hypothetical protein